VAKKNLVKPIILTVVLIILLSILLIMSDWFWDFLSPVSYKALLYNNAGIYKIDPLLVAAIINCESTFNPIATSRTGAVGLMQIMPETAEDIAQELKVDYVNADDLYKPEINIQLGFYYIVKLQKRYNGNLIFSLAAYNAGLKNADSWFAKYKGGGDYEAIRTITFPETSAYVQKVLSTYNWYKFIRKAKRILQFKER
jgi:soluble lytic murein transglycosylase